MSKNVYNTRTNNKINEASDVSVSSLQNGEILVWDSSANKWKNSTASPTGITNITISEQEPIFDFTVTGTTTKDFKFKFGEANSNNFIAATIPYDGSMGFRNIVLGDLPSISLNDLSDATISAPATNQVLKYTGTEWANSYLQDNTYAVNTDCNSGASITAAINTTYLCNLGTLSIPNSSTGACIKIINSGASLTINFPGLVYINGTNYFNTSFTTSEICYMELKNYFNGTAWIVTNLSPRIFYPTTGIYIYYSISALDDLRNVTISAPAESDSLIYSSGWINQKKYGEYFNYVNLSSQTVTAANKTVYFCNLATINFGASTLGECVKVINTNGPLLTINFPGRILYFNANNFNATLTATDACEIVFEGILGGNWQVVSFTGKILNSVTGKNLANNDIGDLRNVTISAPANNQILRFNGSAWVNSAETAQSVTSVFGRTGAISATEGDYSLNLLSDVTLTAPAIGHMLKFNGTEWVNAREIGAFQYNSDGNLSNGQFLYPGWGQNNNEGRTQILLPYNITLTEFSIRLSAAPGNSRIFSIRLNGNIQTSVTISNFQNVLNQAINVVCTAGQLLSIQHINVAANASSGIFNLKYFLN